MTSLLLALHALPALLGCAADPAVDAEVALADDMPTVVVVTWEAPDDAEVQVAFGDGQVSRLAERLDDGRVRVFVVGTPEATEVTVTPVMTVDGQRLEGAAQTLTTGTLGRVLPEVGIEQPGEVEGALLLTTFLGDVTGPVILDREGRPVWYYALEPDRICIDVEPVRGSTDLYVLTQHLYADEEGERGRLLRVGLDGALVEAWDVVDAHHALTQPEPGVVAWVRQDIVEDADGVLHHGEAIDRMGPDGAITTLTDTFTLWPESWDYSIEAGPHANGLSWSEARGAYLMSFHARRSVIELDADGQPTGFALGEPAGWDFSPPEAKFATLHGPSITPDGTLLLFDNGSPEDSARVIEYALNDGVAEQVWEARWPDGDEIMLLGDARRRENGNTLVSWGLRGELGELDPEGEVLWRAFAYIGMAFGNIQVFEASVPDGEAGQ
ncbi:MAG: hypothetical protein H6739_38420 [Alphaproteobacteria bacterium]|nr:hypothetical protein [Alphaproteobacteria bacterium]